LAVRSQTADDKVRRRRRIGWYSNRNNALERADANLNFFSFENHQSHGVVSDGVLRFETDFIRMLASLQHQFTVFFPFLSSYYDSMSARPVYSY
jgi:hypothetical protein